MESLITLDKEFDVSNGFSNPLKNIGLFILLVTNYFILQLQRINGKMKIDLYDY